MKSQPHSTITKSTESYLSGSAMHDSSQAPPHSRFDAKRILRLQLVRIGLCAVLALAIAAALWRRLSDETLTARGLAALTLAYRNHRPTEARISGFTYAPHLNSRGDEQRVDYVARVRAERLLLEA